jgi:hypothetical protein
MSYYCGATVFFSPEPEGSLFAQSVDGSLQIWAAEDYENPMVTEVTEAEAEEIKTRPGWAG